MNRNKGFDLYWENYHRAFEWQSKSRMSHWQARASSLAVENALLRDIIQRELLIGNNATHPVDSRGYENQEMQTECNEYAEEENTTCPSDLEVDEELLAFYEKTIRHKMERKRKQLLERDGEDSQSDKEEIYSMGPLSTAQKTKDMALLYGDEAPKILSMEMSMQINFDMNCNKSNAQLWPNIPLRLS